MSDDSLTAEEHKLIADLGDIWNQFCRVAGGGPTRDADLNEAIHHIHALQKMVMGQAAARSYPTKYRLLGCTVHPPFGVDDAVELVHADGTISGPWTSPYRVIGFRGEMFDCIDRNGAQHAYRVAPPTGSHWRVVPE